jgi:hypothetical protein
MSGARLYRVTSIGRPLDRSFATNRAVIRLLPLAAVLGGVAYVWRHGADAGVLWAAVAGALAAFGGWALARELAPDHDPAAFAAMGVTLAAQLVLDGPPLLPLFLALFLVRIVNRSVGLTARTSDSVLVAALAVGTAWSFGNPWFAFVGGLAFLLDATLPPGLPRHRVLAVICGLAGVWVFGLDAPGAVPAPLAGRPRWLAVGIAVAFVGLILATRRVEARADASGEPLSVHRVRGGMWVGLFVAAQSLLGGPADVRDAALVWATLAGTLVQRPRWR